MFVGFVTNIRYVLHLNYHYQKILGKPCFKIKRFQKCIAWVGGIKACPDWLGTFLSTSKFLVLGGPFNICSTMCNFQLLKLHKLGPCYFFWIISGTFLGHPVCLFAASLDFGSTTPIFWNLQPYLLICTLIIYLW